MKRREETRRRVSLDIPVKGLDGPLPGRLRKPSYFKHHKGDPDATHIHICGVFLGRFRCNLWVSKSENAFLNVKELQGS